MIDIIQIKFISPYTYVHPDDKQYRYILQFLSTLSVMLNILLPVISKHFDIEIIWISHLKSILYNGIYDGKKSWKSVVRMP